MVEALLALAVVAGLALTYWHLVAAEGAYLGPRVVARTYDWVARRYDALKQFHPGDEDWFVAGPVLRGLAGIERPLLLDVATGTGRLPLALLRNRLAPGGEIVGVDLSCGMLRQARAKLRAYGERVHLVWHDATSLPFDDESFDAVACLEALEFLPSPRRALGEMVRVLAPGGLLFVTNRVGPGARLLPGRALSRPVFQQVLASLPLHAIETRPWQIDYDLTVAFKAGERNRAGRAGEGLPAVLRCPYCRGPLRAGAARLVCLDCGQRLETIDGIVTLATTPKRGN